MDIPAAIPRVTVGDPGRAAAGVPYTAPRSVGDPPDTIADGADLGDLVLRAASVRGLLHRQYRTPRQDALAFGVREHGAWVVAAVADGVGSADRSELGAALASRVAVELALDALEAAPLLEIAWAPLVARVSGAIVDLARADADAEGAGEPEAAHRLARRLYSTTLSLIAVETAAIGGVRRGVAVTVGDSPALKLTRTGGWLPLAGMKSAGDDSGIVDTAVTPLPSGPAEPPPAVTPFALTAGEAVFVMTDGVGNPLGNGSGEVGAALAESWQSPPDPLTFASQVGFGRKGFTDDRAVVGVWAREGLV